MSSTTTTTLRTATEAPVQLPVADYSGSSSSNNNNEHNLPPVVFLHGLLGSKRNFASIGKSLWSQLERKRQILALDLRNHGELGCVRVGACVCMSLCV